MKKVCIILLVSFFVSIVITNKTQGNDRVSENIRQYIIKTNRHICYVDLEEIVKTIDLASRSYEIDPYIIAAIIHTESTFRKNVKNGSHIGLMQINWRLHGKGMMRAFDTVSSVEDAYVIRNNILMGTYLLDIKRRLAKGNMYRAIRNYGTGTKAYVDRVTKISRRIKNINS